jgi:fibronectin type 3 domain-containing protein
VTISQAMVAGAGFTVYGANFPLTLNPNQTATLNVEFDPTTSGAATGTLTIASNAVSNPTDVISLSGTGNSTAYEINLTWTAPAASSDPVAGYNVYRSPSGGTSYQQINTSVLTQTTYVDSTVEPGETYDYIVESVDASGNLSGPSNMASVTTP